MDRKKAQKQLKEINRLGGSMRLAAEGWKSDFETLISTIMSARTMDETTIPVAQALFKQYPNAKKLSQARLKDVEKIIRPVNFYRNKAKNVIACAKELDKKYKGVVPHDFEKLLELPGVGRKTANVFLSENDFSAIAIDTHVDYISHYLDWTKSKKMEDVENDIKKLFSKSKWKDINPILVRFGKKYTSRKEKNKLLEDIKKL